MSRMDDLRRNIEPGRFYEDDSARFELAGNPVRVVAYYLPQFHAIPENDLWWGKGFTEWTKVTKSFPRFHGHYQPHLPGELGFYDLRNPEVLYRQAAMARRYGVSGFCIHYYWFAGKTLLEEPLRILLDNPDIRVDFCLNWANENWTREWDGGEKTILMEQKYSPGDDIALAVSLEKALADPRYIRVHGRPLIMIYRPWVLPDIRGTVDRWRNHFERNGYGNPYLVMPQSADNIDPRKFEFDAVAGFPPHQYGFSGPRTLRAWWVKLTHPWYHGLVLSYDRMVRSALRYQSSTTNYTLLPGVCPTWDNHARRQNGIVFYGATPEKYGRWLRSACEHTLQNNSTDERIVFVNAWNEWAEGAHLEPDSHFGFAFLAETGRVMSAIAREVGRGELVYAGR